jgi:hypothetical protein
MPNEARTVDCNRPQAIDWVNGLSVKRWELENFNRNACNAGVYYCAKQCTMETYMKTASSCREEMRFCSAAVCILILGDLTPANQFSDANQTDTTPTLSPLVAQLVSTKRGLGKVPSISGVKPTIGSGSSP